MPELDWAEMPLHQAIKHDWSSAEILIEGSLNSAKTTVALDKELDAMLRWPGIPVLLFRWTEDAVNTKLKPVFETICNLRGIDVHWNKDYKRYELENGSVAYAFGLKAASEAELYNKIRGLGVHRICGDQVEEVKRSVAGELRGRLRPDLHATLSGKRFPFQLTFVANPSDEDFWLSREFPPDNHVKGRTLYSLSVFDNKHLPSESIDSLLRTYPEDHPKHQTMVLGRRGLNITGDPVFEGLFDRDLHARECERRDDAPLIEAFVVGRHNPTWVIGQRTYFGGLQLLGGAMGKRMMLDDFLPLVAQYRREWFPGAVIKTCTAPMGETQNTANGRYTLMGLLREYGIRAQWRDDSNAHDTELTMIEYLAGLMRRRTRGREEAFAISNHPERWYTLSHETGEKPVPFLVFACEAGFVWSEHVVSVSNKTIRQPVDDDAYANAVRCVELLALNFCAQHHADADKDLARMQQAQAPDLAVPAGPNAWMGF